MIKLTNIQVYDYVMLKLDKHQAPTYDEQEISDFFNEAYLEWLDDNVKVGEVSDRNVSLLDRLVRKKDYGSTKALRLSTVTPEPVFRIWAVFSNLNFECRGITEIYTRPVIPKTWDRVGVGLSNPFETPTDWDPMYTKHSEGGDAIITILSDNVPVESEIVYVKTPQVFDAVNNTGGFTEISRDAQYQVIDKVLQKLLINIENLPVAQAVSQTELS